MKSYRRVSEAVESPFADVHRLVVAGFGRLRAALVAHRPSEDVIDFAASVLRTDSRHERRAREARSEWGEGAPRATEPGGLGGKAPQIDL